MGELQPPDCNTQVFKAWMPVMPFSTIPGIVLLWDITKLKYFTVLQKRSLHKGSVDQALNTKHIPEIRRRALHHATRKADFGKRT